MPWRTSEEEESLCREGSPDILPGYGSLAGKKSDGALPAAGCCNVNENLTLCGAAAVPDSCQAGQKFVFLMTILASLSSSFTVCLFPPFYPKLAELKGSSATEYGMTVGVNCLVAFLVTPFIGNQLGRLGVKLSFTVGLAGGGACCALSGLLEFCPAGLQFLCLAICLRVVQSVSNALVLTSSFTYTATFFPRSLGRVFALSRSALNVAKLLGPVLGGYLYLLAGYCAPFLVFGLCQVLLAGLAGLTMPGLATRPAGQQPGRASAKQLSLPRVLAIPRIWFSFLAFITGTLCNGMLSVSLEPQLLRQFHLSPVIIGLLYGLRNGANSVASPGWGWASDRANVKLCLVAGAVLASSSFLFMGAAGPLVQITLPLLITALCLNGAGISGQQVAGVVDGLAEVAAAGYQSGPHTQAIIAGLWSSLSGLGRFVSRAGSGILVDCYGFQSVLVLACGLQALLAAVTAVCVFWDFWTRPVQPSTPPPTAVREEFPGSPAVLSTSPVPPIFTFPNTVSFLSSSFEELPPEPPGGDKCGVRARSCSAAV